MHKYIQYSIIKQDKFWETRIKLEQVVTSLKIMLVFPKSIKTKYSYVSAMGFKVGIKLAFWFINKQLAVYYIIGFVNWKQKIKAYSSSN